MVLNNVYFGPLYFYKTKLESRNSRDPFKRWLVGWDCGVDYVSVSRLGRGGGGVGGVVLGYPGGESFLVSATHNQLKRALRQTRFEGFEAHGGP